MLAAAERASSAAESATKDTACSSRYATRGASAT
tara:strand:+ start:324 stop:425 length:102 start_codon:yes stop_codon:yes gene_type:complete